MPVVAAGGIVDGRGLAAALCLGADGVWSGRALSPRPKRGRSRATRKRSCSAAEDATTITRGYTGKTLRVLANAYTAWWEEHPHELEPFPAQVIRSTNDGAFHLGGDAATPGIDPDRECYPAGQGTGAIGALVPAGEIVQTMVAEAEAVLGRLSQELPGVPPEREGPAARSGWSRP